VYLNLEGTASLLGFAPRRFGEILGKFLNRGGGESGAEDRILWATGALAVHPQPLLELFWNYQIPQDLIDDYGYPELTREMKIKILGANYARKNGIDLDATVAAIPNDEVRQNQNAGRLAEPWSAMQTPARPVAASA
jgi:hypothetical protein